MTSSYGFGFALLRQSGGEPDCARARLCLWMTIGPRTEMKSLSKHELSLYCLLRVALDDQRFRNISNEPSLIPGCRLLVTTVSPGSKSRAGPQIHPRGIPRGTGRHR